METATGTNTVVARRAGSPAVELALDETQVAKKIHRDYLINNHIINANLICTKPMATSDTWSKL